MCPVLVLGTDGDVTQLLHFRVFSFQFFLLTQGLHFWHNPLWGGFPEGGKTKITIKG